MEVGMSGYLFLNVENIPRTLNSSKNSVLTKACRQNSWNFYARFGRMSFIIVILDVCCRLFTICRENSMN